MGKKYKILKTDPVLDTHDFFIDSVEDLAELPIEPASAALVATTGDIYVCTNEKKWTQLNTSNSKNKSNNSSFETINNIEYINAICNLNYDSSLNFTDFKINFIDKTYDEIIQLIDENKYIICLVRTSLQDKNYWVFNLSQITSNNIRFECMNTSTVIYSYSDENQEDKSFTIDRKIVYYIQINKNNSYSNGYNFIQCKPIYFKFEKQEGYNDTYTLTKKEGQNWVPVSDGELRCYIESETELIIKDDLNTNLIYNLTNKNNPISFSSIGSDNILYIFKLNDGYVDWHKYEVPISKTTEKFYARTNGSTITFRKGNNSGPTYTVKQLYDLYSDSKTNLEFYDIYQNILNVIKINGSADQDTYQICLGNLIKANSSDVSYIFYDTGSDVAGNSTSWTQQLKTL